jgi:spore germination protein
MMGNLERKSKMSAAQLGLVLVTTCVGGQIVLMPNELITKAGHGAWLSILVAGVLYGTAAVLAVKIGERFPRDSFVEYFPRIYGRILGSFPIVWITGTLFLLYSLILIGFSRVISLFMFDRTPQDIIALGMVIITTHCAVQDWGTILRVLQLLFFTSIPMMLGFWVLSFFNFVPENLLPLWPDNLLQFADSVVTAWGMYSGYEVILLLLPLVYRGRFSFVKAIGGAFGCMGFIFLLIIVMAIGVLTVKGAQNVPYPTLIVIRGVEIPGTFIERLENYLLLAWIPIVFDTLAMILYFVGEAGRRYFAYADHRPFVLLAAPVLLALAIIIEQTKSYEQLGRLATYLGVGFSLLVLPATYLLLRFRKREFYNE